MQDRHDETVVDFTAHPLKSLTASQFMALGGNAVAFVRPISGADLSAMLSEEGFDEKSWYQLVMSADGTPLMVSDNSEAVTDWLAERNLGVVALH
ncbi:MAG TPA: DUF1150 family protein [Devosiaceae bacterium]|jgi:hypothetical protein